MWTPAVLGAALFTGKSLATSGGVQPTSMMGIVFGYTLMHGSLFISFGAMVASGRLTRDRSGHFTPRVAVITALAVFVGLEVTFVGMSWIVGPDLDLAGRLGSGWIAVANALAAIGMTATIGRAARRLAGEASAET